MPKKIKNKAISQQKVDYLFLCSVILIAWLFLALVLLFFSGARSYFNLLSPEETAGRFILSKGYLEEKLLMDLNEEFDYIQSSLSFSPDGQNFAFINQLNNQEAVVLNGQIGPYFDKVSDLIFSPDSQHFAYLVKEANNEKVLINGQISQAYGWIFPPYFFSKNGEVFAYRARRGSQEMVVINQEESRPYDRVLSISLLPDDSGLVYFALADDQLWRGEVIWQR